MNLAKRRSRLITFRLDEDEYQGLRDQSIAQGARSISDYTRSILSRSIGNQTRPSREALEAEVAQLRREVKRLADKVEGNTPMRLPKDRELEPVS